MKTSKKILLVIVLFFTIAISGCSRVDTEQANPSEPQNISVTETKTPTKTLTPTQTYTPTVEPTPTETPTITPTPEPVLWCSDVIENCYFIGSDIAKIFTVMTLPCFENGGECFSPVEDCNLIPPSVVHVPVEDWAVAWEQEVTGNPEYSMLDPNLYDSETEYCFVDEGIAQMIRDAGNEGYQANKSCLDNDAMPCDVYLYFRKIDCGVTEDNNEIICESNLLISDGEFLVTARWMFLGMRDMSLENALLGLPVEPHWFRWYFGYVYTSEAVGFDEYNVNRPAGITIPSKSQ